MHTGFEFGNLVEGRACGITAEIEAEIVVEDVGFRHIAVNDEFEVVSDAVSRGVDAVFVAHLRHEIGRCMGFAAVGERGRVQVAVDARSDGVVAGNFGAADEESI